MLTAVDTNVVLRRLLRDDGEQLRIAKTVFESGQIFIPASVLMETEWALRSFYKWQRGQIAQTLRNLLHMPNILVDAPDEMIRVLDDYEKGADMADMMHLALSTQTDRFVSFDRGLVRAAKGSASIPVDLLA